MIKVEKLGVILSPTDNTFENNGVLNPGIFQEENNVHIFYRAVEHGNFSTIGYAKSNGPIGLIDHLLLEILIMKNMGLKTHVLSKLILFII